MKEQHVLRIIIPLLLLSLIGLVALQVELLRDVFDQKEVAFDRNAINALHSVARALETREVQSRVLKFMGSQPRPRGYVMTATSDSGVVTKSSGQGGSFRFEFHTPPNTMDSMVVSNDTVKFTHKAAPGKRVLKATINDSLYEEHLPAPAMRRKGPTTWRTGNGFTEDSAWSYMEQYEEIFDPAGPGHGEPLRRQELMAQAMDFVYVSTGRPVEHTITAQLLDSLIRGSLSESHIDLSYAFAVSSAGDDSLRLVSAASHYGDLRESRLTAGLFTADLMGGANRLVLFFPDRNLFILRQMAPSLAATSFFVLIILGSFAYTVATIFRQKRFHTLLSDFINNMTHEFKTPISTISVVTDTLTLPNVIADREKVLHYNTIIRDEIGRMKGHVDKILQMAVLEEGDYELKMSVVDVHPLLADAAEKIRLRVEQREGTLATDFGAATHLVKCDAFHFSNIIFNLLDNAEKYSPGAPHLTLSTANDGGNIVIAVSDEGIGIPEKDQKHVFDRYYRVSTGNLHDVKGFGLGLSYVKLMVEAQNGAIALRSKEGEGTTVTLRFPAAE